MQAFDVAAGSPAREALAADGELQTKPIPGPHGLEQLDVQFVSLEKCPLGIRSPGYTLK